MFILESLMEKYEQEYSSNIETKVIGVFTSVSLIDMRKAWVELVEFYDEAFLEPEVEDHIKGMIKSLEGGTGEFCLQLFIYEIEPDKISIRK